MDFNEGDNTFRILGSFEDGTAVMGWEYWTNEVIDGEVKSRPVRVNEYDVIPVADVNEDSYGRPNLYFFWAFPVYNFDAKRIQILKIRQKTVREVIQKSVKNPKWGDPKNYNFVVDMDKNRKPMHLTSTEPKEELGKDIWDKYKSMHIDMQAWMRGEDPFSTQTSVDSIADDALDALG